MVTIKSLAVIALALDGLALIVLGQGGPPAALGYVSALVAGCLIVSGK